MTNEPKNQPPQNEKYVFEFIIAAIFAAIVLIALGTGIAYTIGYLTTILGH